MDSKPVLDAVLASAALRRPDGREVDGVGVPFVLAPPGYVVAELEKLLPKPVITRQTVALVESGSFVEYVNRFRTDNSVLFFPDFEYSKPVQMTAAIDYHGSEEPSHVKHIVNLTVPLSEQWKRWIGIDSKWHSQAELARFLEENVLDVTNPAQADMMEIVRDLQATKNGEFRSGVRLSNGSSQLTWNETVQASLKGGEMQVPEKIEITIPVFKYDAPYVFEAWFRYRIVDGKLGLMVQLHRAEFLFDNIASGLVKSIQAAVDLPLYRGAMK